MPEVKIDKFDTYKTLLLSLNLLSVETLQFLSSTEDLLVHRTRYGVFVYLGVMTDELLNSIPTDLKKCIDKANEEECGVIHFDTDL